VPCSFRDRVPGQTRRLSACRSAGRELGLTGIETAAIRPSGRNGRRALYQTGLWLFIFAGSLGLFVVRLLDPAPVGMADNGDGPRIMCGLGVGPVTGGHAARDSYAYFRFAADPKCASVSLYDSSQRALLVAARWLTPIFGLPGRVNLIALGVLTAAIAAVGIASLATGLRLRVWAQLLVAAGLWLIMADAAFLDTYASPFSEGATLTGLLLVAAGVAYLGRGWPATIFGLVLAGTGGYLAILSKEQYLTLVLPVCLALLLASAARDRRGLRRFLTLRMGAAVLVAAILAVTTNSYLQWDKTSAYAAALHHEQAVDMIFQDIVNGHGNARAELRALGLPAQWARYAETDSWSNPTVRDDALYDRYSGQLTAGNIVHFLVTHPSRIASVGQAAAIQALRVRVRYLGSYAPSAGHPPGALESRVAVVSGLEQAIPAGLGLLALLPLWVAMIAIAIAALCLRGGYWRRAAAVVVLTMTGCAVAAFIPPAYFAGISLTRHLLGMNEATWLAVAVSVALIVSLLRQGVVSVRWPGRAGTCSGWVAARAPAASGAGLMRGWRGDH
jgi:hypothetical protein